ncbi:GGDEF domain-containing protein [Acuticoccus sp.]|uniref:GGDEF domain-containing protein n=1 Tax=Acuticoccus sp. TaxID=1904378 RepID=UPI003B52F4CB
MTAAFHQLLLSASLLVAFAFVLGIVFDVLANHHARQAAVGAVCAAFLALVMAMPTYADGFVIDGRGVLIVVGSLFGGPVGTAVMLPVPLIMRAAEGGPAVLMGTSGIVLCALVGLSVHLLWRRANAPIARRAVLAAAVASPLCLLGFLAPALGEVRNRQNVVVPLLIWLPFGTLLCGFAVSNEAVRSSANRRNQALRVFEDLTGTVPHIVFQNQLEHHWRMHERYGHEYAYLLVAIDDAAAVRKSIGEAAWERLRAEVATHISRATRECDLCTAIDFDRFGVLLPHASLPFALPVARRVQEAVHGACGTAEAGGITVSIGCAEVDGTLGPHDVEAAAEGELFLAMTRDAHGVIGPWLDFSGPSRTFPGALPVLDEGTAAPTSSSSSAAA